MDEALFALINSTAAITAFVGSRVFWGVAKQGAALPALVLRVVGGSDDPTLLGRDGLWSYRVQIDCYGLDRPTTRLLGRAVTAALSGYSGGEFNDISQIAEREGFEADAANRPFRMILDFNITWRG